MKKHIGKLAIILLPIVAAVTLLFPTYRAYDLTDKQNEYFEKAKKAKNSTDSIDIIDRFEKGYGDALKSAKQNRLKLGLDLRGGMYVTLEVDVVKLLEESVQSDAVDEIFNQVIDKTKREAQESDKEVIDIFKNNFDQIARPKRKFLSDYFDFGGKADMAESEQKILDKLKENETEAIDQAMQVIRQRIDKYGVAEPTIQKQGSRRIMLELPGVVNESEMRHLLQTTARLEFKLVKNDEILASAFYQIDKLLAKELARKSTGMQLPDSTQLPADTTAPQQQTELSSADTSAAEQPAETASDSTAADSAAKAKSDTANPYAGLSENEFRQKYPKDHPFTTLFESWYNPNEKNKIPQQIGFSVDNFLKGDYNFTIYEPFVKKFNQIISRPDVKSILPYGIQILFSAKPMTFKDKSGKEFRAWNFYALKKDAELTGEVITDAIATYDPTTNEPIVSMTMNGDGSDRWAVITGANLKKRIAIVLDEQVYSAPVVQSKIVGGQSQITGMDNAEEAKLLKIVLKAGALKAPVKMIEERIVGPSLGEDSIRSGLTASAIAFALVVLFMLFYYSTGGLIADFSVLLNVLLVISILAAFQGTLSLPGIAGIILTIGMAVDANVLIYERIREELRKGRSLKSAVDEGFSKALSAIMDSNITTFITGLILYFLGAGPIQGFALTLMIGILATLFTQIVISKAMINLAISRGASSFSFGQSKLSA